MKALSYLLFIITLSNTAYSDITGIVVKVYDGDTITVMNDGKLTKVRLYGIDAPEIGQDYGIASKQALFDAIAGNTVTVKENGIDRYGRVIGIVMLAGIDINKEMILRGHAWCYQQYNKNPEYLESEIQARKNGVGLWSTQNPKAPWDFRKEKK